LPANTLPKSFEVFAKNCPGYTSEDPADEESIA